MSAAPAAWALAVAHGLAAFAVYPWVATAIDYRRRDNGLAYILLVLGVGVWNGMVAVQVVAGAPLVKSFFVALANVGALLAGLGWFLFAGTASSTSAVPNERLLYGAAAVLVGLDIAVAVTAPVHGLYWGVPATADAAFVAVAPRPGYWLHTGLLLLLFGAGTGLFGSAWRSGTNVTYSRAYAIGGTVTVLAVLASNALAPGGLTAAPLAAAGLATLGWVQARRLPLRRLLPW